MTAEIDATSAMLTIRLNEFQAKADRAEALRDFLLSMLPLIRSAPG